MNLTHSQGQQWSQGCLWYECTRFVFDPFNKILTGRSLDYFERRIGPYLPDPDEVQCPPITGRLGQVVESGGKRQMGRR